MQAFRSAVLVTTRALDVVLVDDDELLHVLVERRLRDSGLQLISFSDELLALDYLRQTKPDILLVDQRMPRLDGIDLLRELGEAARPNRVYLCSGGPLPEAIEIAARECGAQTLSKDILSQKGGLVALLEGV